MTIEMEIKFLKSHLFVQLISIVDVLFALIVVAPLVVTFWSTTWKLYDLFILPNEPVVSGAVSWLFGLCGQMILMFYQDGIKTLLYFENQNFVNTLILKIYALILAHTFVSFWRGVWSFVDATSSKDLGVVILNIIQNVITLVNLKAFRNTLVPPFMILTDQSNQYNMRTLLQQSVSNWIPWSLKRLYSNSNFNWRKLTAVSYISLTVWPLCLSKCWLHLFGTTFGSSTTRIFFQKTSIIRPWHH